MHPDKNSAPDARAAFDALGQAQRALQDASGRAAFLRAAGEKLLAALQRDRPVRRRGLRGRAELTRG